MLPDKEFELIDNLSRLLLDVITLAEPPAVPSRFASVDSLNTLHEKLIRLRNFLYAASNGDLSGQVELKGYIGGALKTLLANLRHLSWQTQMVASGDFTQRVEFMGEFSLSFNSMVIQLDQTLKELARKETDLSKANKELLNEIAIRKQTEAALRENEETLRVLAITDPLTGLYNRRHFIKLAEDEIIRSHRYSQPLSIIMFDIDHFKLVNDSFGHNAGDIVLKTIAAETSEVLRTCDILARYGGEEFVVLLPETNRHDAAVVAEKLRKNIECREIHAEGFKIVVTASFGVSYCFGRTDTRPGDKVLSEFIASADRALYTAKNAGRNRITVFTPREETDFQGWAIPIPGSGPV